MISLPNYLMLNDTLKSKLFVIYHSAPEPSRIFMVKPSKEISFEKWEEVLKAFSESKEGAHHLNTVQLEGFQMLHVDSLDSMKSLGEKTLKRLGLVH